MAAIAVSVALASVSIIDDAQAQLTSWILTLTVVLASSPNFGKVTVIGNPYTNESACKRAAGALQNSLNQFQGVVHCLTAPPTKEQIEDCIKGLPFKYKPVNCREE
jgi:hypothetical protein